jgi:hypothetical protein
MITGAQLRQDRRGGEYSLRKMFRAVSDCGDPAYRTDTEKRKDSPTRTRTKFFIDNTPFMD